MARPLVSVVLPTYNRADLLPRAIESVVCQTCTEWEIVLVDDGSTDHTPEIVADYQRRLGACLKAVRQDNRGSSAARNRGIDESAGRFVAFLDSDDEFLPDKLTRQLELFELRPELGLVFADYAYIDLNGRRCESAFDTKCTLARRLPAETVAPGLFVCREPLFDWLLREYFIATISGLVRREVLGDAVRFPRDLRYAEEWLFYLKVVRVCGAGFVDEPLCLHHHLTGSLSRNSSGQNVLQLILLVERMGRELAPLPRRQRRILAGHLSRTHQQAAYDAARAGDNAAASAHLRSSFQHRPTMRGLARWLRNSFDGLLGSPQKTVPAPPSG